MKRNASIELFRILLMFGIVYLHVVMQPICGGEFFPKNLLVSCVPAFAMISGCFGVRFRISKIVRLYSLALFSCIFTGGGGLFVDCWFLHAYAIMTLLAWPVEVLISRSRSEDMSCFCGFTLFFVLLILGWGNAMRYNCLVPFIPKVNGLHDFSPMTLFASYLIGRWMGLRKYIQSPWTSRLKMLGLVVVALALIALICSTGLSLVAYNSPVSVSLAAMVFLLFSRVRLPEKLEKCILFISPSMFAVYLLHEYLWFPDLIDCEWMGLGNLLAKACLAQHCPRFVAAFLSAASLFALSVCLDLVRRGLLLAVRSPLMVIYRWIDERFENLMVAMAKSIIRT